MNLSDSKQDSPHQTSKKNLPVHERKGYLGKAGFRGKREQFLENKTFICTSLLQGHTENKEHSGVGLTPLTNKQSK